MTIPSDQGSLALNANGLIGRTFHIRESIRNGFYSVAMYCKNSDLLFLQPLNLKESKVDGTLQLKFNRSAKSLVMVYREDFNAISEVNRYEIKWSLPPDVNRPRESLSDEQKTKFDKLKARIESIADQYELMKALKSGGYSRYLEERARELKINRTTAARHISRLYSCNADPVKAAMSSLFRETSEAPRKVVNKLGRRSRLVSSGHAPHMTGINVTTNITKEIEVFLAGETDRKSVPKAVLYRRFRDFIKRPVNLFDGTTVLKVRADLDITQGQFAYHMDKLESAITQEIGRVGRRKFNKDLRTLIGTARDLIPCPGHTYIIDSTVADVYLVCAVDRKLLIGRPTIYVVIDAFSSMILSVHVSMDNASVDNAKVALFKATTPKDKLLEKLGLQELSTALPAGCKPYMVFADRGELLSSGGRKLGETLKIAISLAAPYRADWKSLVERYFGVQNQMVIHWVPGAVRERARERGNRDVRHDAVLTISGLQRLLLIQAAKWNLTHSMQKHVSCTMLRRQIEATPIGFWNYGLENLHGSPRWLSREDAITALLPQIEATASRAGLTAYGSLRYTEKWMREDDTFYEQRKNGMAAMYVDPDFPHEGYVLTDMEIREVELVDTRQYAQEEIALDDVRMTEDILGLQQDELKQHQKQIQDALSDLSSGVIRDEAKATANALAGDSRSATEKVKGIKVNRIQSKAVAYIGAQAEGNHFDTAEAEAGQEEWLQALQQIIDGKGVI